MTNRAGAEALDRWNAKLLDPRHHPSGGASRVEGVTAYRHDRLSFITRDPQLRERCRLALETVAAEAGCSLDITTSTVRFVAGPGTRPLNAFEVLTALRKSGDGEVGAALGLDHLLSTAEQPGGNPFAIGHGRPGLDSYGVLGYAGRGPVSFQGDPPSRGGTGRRPRVVVLDTGVGEHVWFEHDPVVTTVQLTDRLIGPEIDPGSISERAADGPGMITDRMIGALGSHAGHGTFIAGLLRQSCPEAEIVALAVMGADGVVPESTLTDALLVLHQKQREVPGWADALVLSLGYYAETAEDLGYNAGIKGILLDLARAGVAIFCAAGNDATARPSFPAAFAVDPAFADDPEVVPMSSVGALNPDGSVAAFSNFGPWVTTNALGVNLVSTAPSSADGSQQSAGRASGFGGRSRSVADADSLQSGFASWSGTSFAAPVVAGRYLSDLRDAAGVPDIAARRELLARRTGATSDRGAKYRSNRA